MESSLPLPEDVWNHEGCSFGNDPVNVSDLAGNGTVFALVCVTLSPQGSEQGRACQEAEQCWECSTGHLGVLQARQP